MQMNKTNKVWVINQFASLPKYSYGAGERFFFLSKFLNQEGYNVKVISGGFNHLFKHYPETKRLFTAEITPFAEYIWVKLRKYDSDNYIWRTLSWFEFAFKLFFMPVRKDRPDVVIVSSMSLLPIVFAIWLKWKYKIKFILEIRDIWPLTPIEIGGYSKHHPLVLFLGYIERLGYKYSDYIVSVLPGFQKYLKERGFEDKRFVWIPNGISKSSEANDNHDSLISLPNGKFNIVYTGTLGNANAMEYLIEAAKILKDNDSIHISLVGDGPLKCDLQKQSSGLNNISFIPKVLKEDLIGIINQASVCYIGWHNKKIYEYGVSANKYNDYMLAKKAILSSSNITDDPVLMANCGLRVLPSSPEAIVAGILKLQNMSRKELSQMGINGYEFLQKNQVYDVLAEKYLLVLKSVYDE